MWSTARNGWVPQWLLGKFAFFTTTGGVDPRPLDPEERIRAVSVAGERLWLFRSVREGGVAVEARHAESLQVLEHWRMPRTLPPLIAACSESGDSALTLLESGVQPEKGPPRLVRLRFDGPR